MSRWLLGLVALALVGALSVGQVPATERGKTLSYTGGGEGKVVFDGRTHTARVWSATIVTFSCLPQGKGPLSPWKTTKKETGSALLVTMAPRPLTIAAHATGNSERLQKLESR